MSLLSRIRRRAPEPWPADRSIRFITSFNDVLFDASGRRCVTTFREQNPNYEIWAYVEAAGERPTAAMESYLEAMGVTVVRLSELPLLQAFLDVAGDVIPRDFGGQADAGMFPGEGPQTGDVWFRKHMYRWFRKIVAVEHASAGYDDVLFWMDCDCSSKAPLPYAVIERAFSGAGVIHMLGNRTHSETGLVGYDFARAGVHELIAAMKHHYMSREFERYTRWDDCITLDLCLARPGAPSSRDIAKRAVGHGDVLPTTRFAPFLEHDKGLHSRGLGLMR